MSDDTFSGSSQHLEDDIQLFCLGGIDSETSKVSMSTPKGINDIHAMVNFNPFNGNL